MKLTVIAAALALLIGLGAGYLMWGERARQATDERNRAVYEADGMKAQVAEDLRKLQQELIAERTRRQRLEEVLSEGRK
jgi:lipopolysaccharide export system protein LptC